MAVGSFDEDGVGVRVWFFGMLGLGEGGEAGSHTVVGTDVERECWVI